MAIALAARINLILSLFGAITFGVLLLYVSFATNDFERRSHNFVIAQIQERAETILSERVPNATIDRAAEAAEILLEKLRERAGQSENESTGVFIRYYRETMDGLRNDLQTFAGSTLVAFLMATALTHFRRKAARHLLPIAIILTIATALSVTWYALGQDWLIVILFHDYWGWLYAALLGFLVALMLDIAFNKAHITSAILDAFASALGTAPFLPC